MGAAYIRYYPSAEEQWALMRRHVRSRMRLGHAHITTTLAIYAHVLPETTRPPRTQLLR